MIWMVLHGNWPKNSQEIENFFFSNFLILDANFSVIETKNLASRYDVLFIIDIIVDVTFIIDIVINFRTTYVNHSDEVSKWKGKFQLIN